MGTLRHKQFERTGPLGQHFRRRSSAISAPITLASAGWPSLQALAEAHLVPLKQVLVGEALEALGLSQTPARIPARGIQ